MADYGVSHYGTGSYLRNVVGTSNTIPARTLLRPITSIRAMSSQAVSLVGIVLLAAKLWVDV